MSVKVRTKYSLYLFIPMKNERTLTMDGLMSREPGWRQATLTMDGLMSREPGWRQAIFFVASAVSLRLGELTRPPRPAEQCEIRYSNS
ncbi:MAG: hypothetical protein KKB51_03515 [Candidatus Riflebacteria bacterium]|nr:hypothetical protein [Candidatus Riflebacteria bacterium]